MRLRRSWWKLFVLRLEACRFSNPYLYDTIWCIMNLYLLLNRFCNHIILLIFILSISKLTTPIKLAFSSPLRDLTENSHILLTLVGVTLRYKQQVLTICWPKWFDVKVWPKLLVVYTHSVLLLPKLNELKFWQNQPPPAPYGVWLKIGIFYSHLWVFTLQFRQQVLTICWPK